VTSLKLGIVGLGKIARDQHLPAVAASGVFQLAGIASPEDGLPGIPSHRSLADLLEAVPALEAVSLCTPPQIRFETARFALERRLHVLLEKPPCVTVSEAQTLIDLAQRQGVALFAAWHSRFAPAVEPARRWAATRRLRSVAVTWKEDVRIWHPGQQWIWQAGGLGVFDPGINALSILTQIIPGPLALKGAELHFPRNCETPAAAELRIESSQGVTASVTLDFLHAGTQQHDLDLRDGTSHCLLTQGGGRMSLDGKAVELPATAEYPALYARFAELVRDRSIDADIAPLQLVADAFLCGRHTDVEPFHAP
jgi:D-galactose 1-dehydrogenase